MPSWLISIILNLVLKFGIPWLLDWLHKKFPWLPLAQVQPVLQDYMRDVNEAKVSKKEARRRAHERLKECYGIACPADIKRDDI